MCNQTYTDRTKEPKYQRRVYLAKRAGAYLCILSLFLLCLAIGLWSRLHDRDWLYGLPPLFVGNILGLCSGAMMLIAWNIGRSVWRLERSHRLPPVAEQIAALPAETVLVRGSEQPPAQSSELLRAAQGWAETGAVELLRSSEGRAE